MSAEHKRVGLMDIDSIAFTELLAAKFTHDLAGPLGAVNNGIEFIQEDDAEIRLQAMDLLASSAKEAIARLQFFRFAYGTLKQSSFDVGNLLELTNQFFASSKITIKWQGMETIALENSLPATTGKLLANMITVVASSLIYGGTITISATSNSGNSTLFEVLGSGKGVKLDNESRLIFAGEAQESHINTRTIQSYLTIKLAESLGTALTLAQEEQRMVLSVEIGGV